ncbi:MAG: peptidylprolyl isomerase [Verrucomicrobiota bacterium]
MRDRLFALITCCLATASVNAGIHADFTVSEGGSPLGTFRVRLDFDKAPRTCANFIGLADGRRPWFDGSTGKLIQNTPFYDGLTFHRLIHDFVIQSGSPDGTGTDGPGFTIQDEYDVNLRHSGRYILSMAKKALQDSGGSQFFITLRATPELDDKHSVFGEVITGTEIIDAFTNAADFPTETLPSGQKDVPITPITIDSVILGGTDLASFDIEDPALKLPQFRTIRYKDVATDLPNDFFSVTFDRAPQTDYYVYESPDLANYSSIVRLFSIGSEPGYNLPFMELDPDRFFLHMTAVDYGEIYNPSFSDIPAGTDLTFTRRSGSSVTIHLDPGGSTWSDSLGNSGSLTSLSITDSLGSSGLVLNSDSLLRNADISQFSISASFDTPAGETGWTQLTGIPPTGVFGLSFHTPTSGWCNGLAIRSGGLLEEVYQSFTLSPSAP